ncbi:MAG TPA: hypothetical protein VK536_00140 [Candidatus Limnocylindrales bacterium]|nr:hypothetical protein [Candidatus Limnocylindrales bacterium]
MTLLENNSYERMEELPEQRRREKQLKKFENLAVNQPQSPFFKTASAWAIIANSDI